MTVDLQRLAARVVAPSDGGATVGGFHTEIAWSELLEHVSGVSRLQLSGLLTRRPLALLPHEATGTDAADVLAGYRDDVVGSGMSSNTAARFDTALDELRGLGRLAETDETGPVAQSAVTPTPVVPTQVTPTSVAPTPVPAAPVTFSPVTVTPVEWEDPEARRDQLAKVATILAARKLDVARAAASAAAPESEVPASTWLPHQPSTPQERTERKRRRAVRRTATPAETPKRHYVRGIVLALIAYGVCRAGFPDVAGPADLAMPAGVFIAAAVLAVVSTIPRGVRIIAGVLPGVLLVGFGTHSAIDLPLVVRFAAFVAGLVTTVVYVAVAGRVPVTRRRATGD